TGNVVTQAPPCSDEATAPPTTAMVKTGKRVEGGVALPNGRTLFDDTTESGLALGHPVDMIAHPELPFVYVAAGRYRGGSDDVRCAPAASGVKHRGVHVVCIDRHATEMQSPEDVAYRGTAPSEGTGCADDSMPFDGGYGLSLSGKRHVLYASTGIS